MLRAIDAYREVGGGSVAPDAGGDHNWNTATHWTGGTVPTSADVATFDATSTVDCDIMNFKQEHQKEIESLLRSY